MGLMALSSVLSLPLAVPAQAQDVWPGKPIEIAPEAIKIEGIETAKGVKGALSPHIDTNAYVALDGRRTTRIRPVGVGRVQDVRVVPGQAVHRGEVLLTYLDFTLSDDTQRLSSAEASLAQAQAAEADAEQAYERAKTLRGGAVSAGEVHRRYARLKQAQALVRQGKAQLQNAKERMARFTTRTEKADGIVSSVISPFDGIVRRVGVTAGQEISGSGALAPVEVDDLSKVWIISQVDQAAAIDLRHGDQQLTWLRPNEPPIKSTVDLIESAVDPQTRHVLVRSLVANKESRLRPDMLVRTRLFISRKVPGVVIPSAAMQTIGAVPCVFVMTSKNHYEARKVTAGPELDGKIVITKGLKAGETVVTKGSFTVKSQILLGRPSGKTDH